MFSSSIYASGIPFTADGYMAGLLKDRESVAFDSPANTESRAVRQPEIVDSSADSYQDGLFNTGV